MHRESPAAQRDTQINATPGASAADLPGCSHLRCKSSDLEINSVHGKELFQQNGARQERGYVDRAAVPAVPALGIPQLEPLFTQLSARSTAHPGVCCSFPKARSREEMWESSSILSAFPSQPGGAEACLEPGKPKSSEHGRFLSFPIYCQPPESIQKVESMVPLHASREFAL